MYVIVLHPGLAVTVTSKFVLSMTQRVLAMVIVLVLRALVEQAGQGRYVKLKS
jgi:hypothetical protein